jgi:hypothetical protein
LRQKNIQKILKIGLAFSGKEVAMQSIASEWELVTKKRHFGNLPALHKKRKDRPKLMCLKISGTHDSER